MDLVENCSRKWICYPFETWKIRRLEVERRVSPKSLILIGYWGDFLLESPKYSFLYFSAKLRSALLGVNIPSHLVRAHKKDLPDLESRFGVAQFNHPNILDLQSHFFMLFYSYWQTKIHYCIIFVNLWTWRKESPGSYWKTETFILAHEIQPGSSKRR